MAGFVHGKDGSITVDSDDLSAFVNNVTLNRAADAHDVTTYGNDSHRKFGGLFDGSITLDGIFENGTTSPRDTLNGALGTVVTIQWRPEGAGSGLANYAFDALVQSYVETAPVADMITWSATLEIDDDVTESEQSA